MNDLISILTGMPKGLKLYSAIHGEVHLERIESGVNPCIHVSVNKPGGEPHIARFDPYGKFLSDYQDGECMLFPSKENRDWGDFKKHAPKFNPLDFSHFQKILYSNRNEMDGWHCGFVDSVYKDEDDRIRVKVIGYNNTYIRVIPFNDDTEKLCMASGKECPEYYNWWTSLGALTYTPQKVKARKAELSKPAKRRSKARKAEVNGVEMSAIEIKVSRKRRVKKNVETEAIHQEPIVVTDVAVAN